MNYAVTENHNNILGEDDIDFSIEIHGLTKEQKEIVLIALMPSWRQDMNAERAAHMAYCKEHNLPPIDIHSPSMGLNEPEEPPVTNENTGHFRINGIEVKPFPHLDPGEQDVFNNSSEPQDEKETDEDVWACNNEDEFQGRA